jgi:hypothetical protein
MTRLAGNDRRVLVALLARQPLLQMYKGRRQMVELAGLNAVVPQVDLEGPTLVAIGELVQVLEAYGRVTYEHEALGLFLNAIKETIGPSDEAQAVIDDILGKYKLMVPSKSPGSPTDSWRPIDVSAAREKIIYENTLRHVAFLERGLDVSRCVALLDVGGWTGTGFMVAPSILLTNNHVLPSQDLAASALFKFNYQLGFDGEERKVENYSARPEELFYTSEELDFSLISIAGSPGVRWGYMDMVRVSVTVAQRVNVIQHPAGMPKQISMQSNFVEYVDENVLQYVASTLAGSSGSPVLNDRWQLVALHHAGGNIPEPGTGDVFFRNEGIRVGAILDALPSDLRAMVVRS